MKIVEVRRKVNDSYIGGKVNGSIPGIIIEGLSRKIMDSVNNTKYDLMFISAFLLMRKKTLEGLVLSGQVLIEALIDSSKDMDPKTHYSHKSQLYEKISDDCKESFMKRVPFQEALLKKISRYSRF